MGSKNSIGRALALAGTVALAIVVALAGNALWRKDPAANALASAPGSAEEEPLGQPAAVAGGDEPRPYGLISLDAILGNASGPVVTDYGDTSTHSFTFRVNPEMPVFACVVTIDNFRYKDSPYPELECCWEAISKVDIYDLEGGELLQSIDIAASQGLHQAVTKTAAYFVDVTFDGNLDILIPDSSIHGVRLEALVWDADTGWFNMAEFGYFSNPCIDAESRLILSHAVIDIGDGGEIWGKYEYINGMFSSYSYLSLGTALHSDGLPHGYEWRYEWKHSYYLETPDEGEFVLPLTPGGQIDFADPLVAGYLDSGSYWDLNSPVWDCPFLYDMR